MRCILRWLAIILPLGLAVAGCADVHLVTPASPDYITGDFGTLTYRAIDQITGAASGIDKATPVVVTSLADVQNLDQSSAFGNIVADMIRTRLVQDGYATSEIRLRNAVSLQKNQGEFLLSRDSKAILPPRNVAVILTGTYTTTLQKVYISLKFISAYDGNIIAGVDYVVPHREVAELLEQHGT